MNDAQVDGLYFPICNLKAEVIKKGCEISRLEEQKLRAIEEHEKLKCKLADLVDGLDLKALYPGSTIHRGVAVALAVENTKTGD
jgi:hypothetical protein